MASDGLAAMRAAQQGGYSSPLAVPAPHSSDDYASGGNMNSRQEEGTYVPGRGGRGGYSGDNYEMQEPRESHGGISGTVGPQDMSSYMNEISDLEDGIKAVNANVEKIRELHSRALSQLDETRHTTITAQLQTVTGETSRMTNDLKNRINSLQQSNARIPPGDDANVRRTQIEVVKKRFMDIIQKYQQVEQESQQKYRLRMERRYRIVKPDATEAEIRQAVESGDQSQVFSRALMNSNRHGDAEAAYRETQERHEDIRKIEKTLTELGQMLNDLVAMVEGQARSIDSIDAGANRAKEDLRQGENLTTDALNSAKAAWWKRWMFFWISVAILVAIGVIVAIVVVTKK